MNRRGTRPPNRQTNPPHLAAMKAGSREPAREARGTYYFAVKRFKAAMKAGSREPARITTGTTTAVQASQPQ